MNSIYSIPNKNYSGNFWVESSKCSGFVVSDQDCPLRTDEMTMVSYTPKGCLSGAIGNCDKLVAYARLDIRN